MPAVPLNVDWNLIKISCLARAFTFKEAAVAFGISVGTIKARSSREKWFQQPVKATSVNPHERALEAIHEKQLATELTAEFTTEAARESMAAHRNRFQKSLAKKIASVSEYVDGLDPAEIFNKSDKLASLVKAGNQIHGLEKNSPECLINLEYINHMRDVPAFDIVPMIEGE